MYQVKPIDIRAKVIFSLDFKSHNFIFTLKRFMLEVCDENLQNKCPRNSRGKSNQNLSDPFWNLSCS